MPRFRFRRLPSQATLRRGALAALALGTLAATPLSGGPALITPMIAHAEPVLFTMTGSTQMYSLGQLMSTKYSEVNPNVTIGVDPTSSQFAFDNTCAGSTEVGMSDVYIQDSQLEQNGCGDMTGIPVAISATPLVYNLPGAYFTKKQPNKFTLVHPVRLNAHVIAAIYMGKIVSWNDPTISRLNPGMKLPAQRIRAFNSAEPGGSGFVFNQWLALSDAKWKSTVGISLQPAWPTNGSIGQPSSGATVQAILSTPYSMGFVGFDYAISNHLQAAALQNASGVYLTPSLNGLSYAINKALQNGMPADFRKPFVTIADPRAFNPACFEFYVVHKDLTTRYSNPSIRRAVKDFLTWAVDSDKGQKFIEQIEYRKIGTGTADELAHGFIPVPEALRGAIQGQVAAIKD